MRNNPNNGMICSTKRQKKLRCGSKISHPFPSSPGSLDCTDTILMREAGIWSLQDQVASICSILQHHFREFLAIFFRTCSYWGRPCRPLLWTLTNSHGHRSRCSPEFSSPVDLLKTWWTNGEPGAPAALLRCSQTCSVPRCRSRPRGWPSAGDTFWSLTTGNTEAPEVTNICSFSIDFY